MAEAGRVAIATLVMRNKEYLVAIRPDDDALALHTMYFSDEVRSPGRELELPDTDEVSDRELSMAQLLIESMESDWDPARFHDTHREKVEALIEEKRQGHEIVIQAPEPAPAKVVDLMEALNASIAAAARSGGAKAEKTGENGQEGARRQAGGTRRPGCTRQEGAQERQAAGARRSRRRGARPPEASAPGWLRVVAPGGRAPPQPANVLICSGPLPRWRHGREGGPEPRSAHGAAHPRGSP